MTRASRMSWYAGRAAAMSPREMAWRARCMSDALLHRDGLRERSDDGIRSDWPSMLERFRAGDGRAVLLDRDRARRVADEQPAQMAQLIAEADGILAGEREFFGYPRVNVGARPDWNLDPFTEYRWPAVPAGRIDPRVATSDPKWIWELNRLQHLPALAQAWLVTGESRYADGAFDHLDSWLEQNPPGTGIAWRGAFEAGIRAISVAVALQGLRDAPGMTVQRYRRTARLLDASARYCWRARSRYSSANNHLVGELAGLIAVHLIIPELDAPATSCRSALDALAGEAQRQILPDGAGAEQSVSYQMFTAELLAIVVLLLRLYGERVPSELTSALGRSSKYLVSLVGSADPDPRYGDDDDGFGLRLGAEPKRTVRDHLGIMAAVTGDAVVGSHGRTTLTSAWISAALGGSVPEVGGDGPDGGAPASLFAPHGGLVVLRTAARRLTMDVGPLGYLSTAAHGHADALAVTLSDGYDELIVDPGTGSYYGNPAWRSAFRGTRAHATVCVDDTDQSEMGGPFYWRRQATTTVHAVDLERGIVDAEHDGYRRLDDPVVHRRLLIAAPGGGTTVVVDLLDGRSVHDVTVSWPLHPDVDVVPVDDGHLAVRDGRPVLQLCYAATVPIQVEQRRADCRSHLGWLSDRLEARKPAWLLGAHARTALPLAMLSVLRNPDAGEIALPDVIRDGATLTVSWSECGLRRGLKIDLAGAGSVADIPLLSPVRLVSES